MMTVTKKCEECGKIHTVKVADLNRGWGRACSKHCAAKIRERINGHRFMRNRHVIDRAQQCDEDISIYGNGGDYPDIEGTSL
jgi:hypothetical protein